MGSAIVPDDDDFVSPETKPDRRSVPLRGGARDTVTDRTVDWLLAGDPAIRWQVLLWLYGRLARGGARDVEAAQRRGREFLLAHRLFRSHRTGEVIEPERRRHADGRWFLERRYRGRTWFEMERIRGASRWNTLRALRVLRWWERGTGGSASALGVSARRGPGAVSAGVGRG